MEKLKGSGALAKNSLTKISRVDWAKAGDVFFILVHELKLVASHLKVVTIKYHSIFPGNIMTMASTVQRV
jgi:hypothetical protein